MTGRRRGEGNARKQDTGPPCRSPGVADLGHRGGGLEWRAADAAMQGSSGTQRFQPWQLFVA